MNLQDLKQKKIWLPSRAKKTFKRDGTSGGHTSQEEWMTFDEANSFNADVSICLHPSNGIVVVDLDKCVAPDGTISPDATHILHTLDSFTEKSKSKTGLHIYLKGSLPEARNRIQLPDGVGFEAYAEGRHIVFIFLQNFLLHTRSSSRVGGCSRRWGG